MPYYGSINYAAYNHQLIYSSQTAQNKPKKTKSHTKLKEPTFQKMEVYGKRGQENGTKCSKG